MVIYLGSIIKNLQINLIFFQYELKPIFISYIIYKYLQYTYYQIL